MNKTMSECKRREEMCEVGRRVYDKGFAAANDGNISYRLGDDRVLCTPTRVSKGFMKPDDLCIVDMEGKQVSGTRKRSSEILLHLTTMKTRPDIKPCVHSHTPPATAVAVATETNPTCTTPESEVLIVGGVTPPYVAPGPPPVLSTVIPVATAHPAIHLTHPRPRTALCGGRFHPMWTCQTPTGAEPASFTTCAISATELLP